MSKRTKTAILITSFLAFFVLSYFIISYAYGYQFNFANLKWVETGGLFTKANLDSVEVYINGHLKGKTSFFSNTFIEKNLLPGKYDLKFSKEGFPKISKTIEIKSGEANQLTHLYLPDQGEINDFIESSEPVKENPSYFINKKDGLLYRKTEDEKIEKISSESVYIKNFELKVLEKEIYLASKDLKAPGVFLLSSDGNWENIHSSSANDLVLSPDNKKLAVVGQNEISILWLKNENEPPYFEKSHKEVILKTSEKIERVLWFKTSWHLIYLTESGKTNFVEVDPSGGRNDLII